MGKEETKLGGIEARLLRVLTELADVKRRMRALEDSIHGQSWRSGQAERLKASTILMK